MPALPPVANCLKYDVHFSAGLDTRAMSRLHFTYTGSAPSGADCVSLAGSARAAWNTNIKSLCSVNNELIFVTVTDIASNTGAAGTDTTAVPGTRAGSNLQGATAALFNHTISRRYRGGKPRTYLPLGVAGDTVGAGAWQSAFQTAANTGIAAFIAAIKASSSGSTVISNFVSVSYYSGFTNKTGPTGRSKARSTPRATPLVDVINGSVLNPIPGTQRRRAGR